MADISWAYEVVACIAVAYIAVAKIFMAFVIFFAVCRKKQPWPI